MPKRGRPESTSSTSAEPKTLPDAVEALVAWLRSNGASLDGLAIRANADSSYGLYATKAIPADAAIGNLPTDLILDPLAVLADDKVALASIKLGGTPAFSFWLALAAARKDPQHRFAPYLAALPLEAPDPCAWPASQRTLLDGTPLAPRVEGQRRLLADEHRKIAPKAAKHVSFEDLLWARGVHLSRCFPRALVDASRLSTPHEVLASNAIDGAAALTVEHGGTFSAPRVAWRDDSGADAGGDGDAVRTVFRGWRQRSRERVLREWAVRTAWKHNYWEERVVRAISWRPASPRRWSALAAAARPSPPPSRRFSDETGLSSDGSVSSSSAPTSPATPATTPAVHAHAVPQLELPSPATVLTVARPRRRLDFREGGGVIDGIPHDGAGGSASPARASFELCRRRSQIARERVRSNWSETLRR